MTNTALLKHLAKDELAFFKLLQKELGGTREQVLQDIMDYYHYGMSHCTTLNFTVNAITFLSKPKVLANGFVQQELRTYQNCVNENFAIEMLEMMAKINQTPTKDKEFVLSNMIRDYDFPLDIVQFLVGMIGSLGCAFDDLAMEQAA